MKAAVVTSFEHPPQYADFPDPETQDGEKLVTVTAAALHQIVRSAAKGSHYSSSGKLPFVAGMDAAGRLANGTRVFFGFGRFPYGTMAERSLAKEPFCFPLPDGVDDETAAATCNPGMSSWAALEFRADFKPGQSVLVLGATGSSGKMAVQIAKRLGAGQVAAAGRNPEELAKLTALGADEVISLEQPRDDLVAAFHKFRESSGLDVVLDYIWGPPAEALLASFAVKGTCGTPRIRYVQIGNMAGKDIALSAPLLRSTGLEMVGSGLGSVNFPDLARSIQAFLAESATKPFVFDKALVPLSAVTETWESTSDGTRIVFLP